MPSSGIRPETTLAIILGASNFPKTDGLLFPSASFRKSAEDFRDYLLSPDHFELPEDNLLYLFDASDASSRLDEKVGEFIKGKVEASKSSRKIISDVIVYYVGHGGFAAGTSEYYLALSDTRNNNPLFSSYSIRALATTLKEFARNIRRYVILDCCFSASAYSAFMSSGPGQVASKKASEAFEQPGKGTALLCASSAANPAIAPEGEVHTMFSGAMLEILRSNPDAAADYLSFKDLQQLIVNKLQDKYDQAAVRPEIHFPNQPEGDIGDIPFFPNSYQKKKAQHRRMEVLESAVSTLTRQQKNQEITLDGILDALANLREAQEKLIIVESGTPDHLPGKQRKRRFGKYIVSETDWESIPLPVKQQIITMNDQFIGSIILVILCLFIFWLDWFGAAYFPSKILQNLVVFPGLIVFSLMLFSLMRRQKHRLFLDAVDSGEESWMHLDVVLALNRVNACELFPGFFVDRKTLSLTTIFMFSSTGASVFLTLLDLSSRH